MSLASGLRRLMLSALLQLFLFLAREEGWGGYCSTMRNYSSPSTSSSWCNCAEIESKVVIPASEVLLWAVTQKDRSHQHFPLSSFDAWYDYIVTSFILETQPTCFSSSCQQLQFSTIQCYSLSIIIIIATVPGSKGCVFLPYLIVGLVFQYPDQLHFFISHHTWFLL